MSDLFGITHDIQAKDLGIALRGGQKGGKNPQRRRLAGTIRPNEAEEISTLDPEIEGMEGFHVSEIPS
jgi:hypothetical protein